MINGAVVHILGTVKRRQKERERERTNDEDLCKVLNGICIEQDRTQCKQKKGCLGHPSAPRNASESPSLAK